jgi:pyruvate/2-oxoglutarate dehydrogenase complex dihydrolipoamide dehydrogenase (E3) component
VAAEIADFIAERGKRVTIIEMRDVIAPEMEPISRQMLIERLETRKVKMLTKTLIQEVTAKGVKIQGLEGKKPKALHADTVVVALGAEPVEFDIEEIKKAGIEVYFIGDAKEVSETAQATRDGFLVGISI